MAEKTKEYVKVKNEHTGVVHTMAKDDYLSLTRGKKRPELKLTEDKITYAVKDKPKELTNEEYLKLMKSKMNPEEFETAIAATVNNLVQKELEKEKQKGAAGKEEGKGKGK